MKLTEVQVRRALGNYQSGMSLCAAAKSVGVSRGCLETSIALLIPERERPVSRQNKYEPGQLLHKGAWTLVGRVPESKTWEVTCNKCKQQYKREPKDIGPRGCRLCSKGVSK